jgi:hypothetical protein
MVACLRVMAWVKIIVQNEPYLGEAFPVRGIPIDILRAFVAVVDSRGFTRAAE